MEKEEQSLEAEEITPLVRNSRNGDEIKILEKNGGVSKNGVFMRKSYKIESQSGDESENEELLKVKREESDWVLEIEEKIEEKNEESDRLLENGAKAINGEKNSEENLVFHDKLEGACPKSTYISKTLIVEGPARTEHDISSLDPAIQSNGGASVVNNQHEEEVEENGVSSSNVEPSDSSSQEGVNSSSAYTIRETILKGPAKYDFKGGSIKYNQHEEEVEQNGVSSSNVEPPDSSSQEGVNSTSTYTIREPILKGPAKYDFSSLENAFQSKGGSRRRHNQHEEEVEQSGVSSSNVEPPDSSSQEVINSTSTYTTRETIRKGPAKYNYSSLDVAFQSKDGSITYNQHEEVEENGVSSSNIEPSDSSSQEGVNSTSTYTIRETILKGPAKYDFSSLDVAFQSKGGSITYNQHEEVEQNGVSSSKNEPPDSSSQEGVNSTTAYAIREPILKGPARHNFSSLDPSIEFNGASIISNQYKGESEKNGVSSSSQEGGTSHEPSKEIESAETEVINEDDLEIAEFDVERVIQKQTTHDLFCPNCKSCITKRVILRKRKRKGMISGELDKRPKTGIEPVGTVPLPPNDQVGNEDSQTPETDEEEPYRGPAIFRCLSCFGIFIPTRNGFRFFKSAGGENGEENLRNEQTPDIKRNWFSNIFSKENRQKTPFKEGSSSETNVQQGSSSIPSSDHPRESGQVLQDADSPARKTAEHEGRDLTLPNLDNPKSPLLEARPTDDAKSDALAVDQQMESKPSPAVHISRDKDVTQLPTSSPSGWTVGDPDDTLIAKVPIPNGEKDFRATIVTTNAVDNENGDVFPAKGPQRRTTETTVDFSQDKPPRTEITSVIGDAPAAQGDETRIDIVTHTAPLPLKDEGVIPVPVPQSGAQISAAATEGLGAREEQKIEVIKSIVYGGLAETMTSLSVVSSAAGGGAATLNVLALGAANLIGGLFIIAHNLWDLRCDRVEEQLSNQVTEQADRYRQLLGRRQNFALHAVVAIMSYVVFGLVPPVVYGFSFRESEDKQLKLLMVAAASLVCIVLLAVGKVYVQRPQRSYFKTVMTFVVLGIAVSGVSWAAGGLVERLLEKLGLFEPSSAAPGLAGPGMRSVGSGWASY